MNTQKEKAIYHAAVKCWGAWAQLNQLQEECAELIASINHYRRGRTLFAEDLANIIEELADVDIMIHQARHILDITGERFPQARNKKLLSISLELALDPNLPEEPTEESHAVQG